MITFEVSIVIEKPVEEVFGFVTEGENVPKWNSAVKSVRKISEGPISVGTKYAIVRQLPSGSAENIYEVVGTKKTENYPLRSFLDLLRSCTGIALSRLTKAQSCL